MASRKEITKFIVDNIDAIMPDKYNKERTQTFLDGMSDKEFNQYIRDLGTGKQVLHIINPNGSKVKLNVEKNIKLAKSLGVDIFQRIWSDTPDGKGRYLSQDKYMILKLPVRRQAQLLIKKISIPKHNKSVDSITGQPAGDSKGSKISYPEVQMLASLGLRNVLGEFMKYRGGDSKGFHAMNTMIHRNGAVSLKAIEPYSGKVTSTITLSTYLTAMHLLNNL